MTEFKNWLQRELDAGVATNDVNRVAMAMRKTQIANAPDDDLIDIGRLRDSAAVYIQAMRPLRGINQL